MFKSESFWTVLCPLVTLVLVALAATSLREERMFPAAGYLLLATILVFKPGAILFILLLILGLIILLVPGILEAIMEYKSALRKSLKNSSYAQEIADAETLENKIYWSLRDGPMCPSYLAVELSASVEDVRAILQEMEEQKHVEQVSTVGVKNNPDEIPRRLLHW